MLKRINNTFIKVINFSFNCSINSNLLEQIRTAERRSFFRAVLLLYIISITRKPHSGNLQHVSITQDNANQMARGIINDEVEAAKWHDEFLKEVESEM